MRKPLLAAFCILALHSFSQTDKFGISAQVFNPTYDVHLYWFNIDYESIDNHNLKDQSFGIGSQFYYNLKNETQLRFRFGWSRIHILEYQDQTIPSLGIHINDQGLGTQQQFHFAPGVGWSMSRNRFQLIGGFELPINYVGRFDLTADYREYTIANDSLVEQSHSTISIPAGFSIGLGAYLGFVYNFKKHISVGAEFSPSLLYGNYGGRTATSAISSPYQFEATYTDDGNTGFTFYQNRFSLNIFYRFQSLRKERNNARFRTPHFL
ncbi:MAG: hypothetical protein RL632_1040 [Bacteroidota bacterium]